MSMRRRRWADGFGFRKWHDAGVVKLTFILTLAACFVFLISIGVQQTNAAECDCGSCHGDQHGPNWQGCSTCHGNPPDSGSHAKHFGAVTIVGQYGDTRITQDFDPNNVSSYQMGCGNCHPLDNTQHRNGTVNVELYNAAAPAGSLKAKNLASASYTPGGTTFYDNNGLPYTLGSCSSVYCHSYNAWTTPGGVPNPWPQYPTDPPVPPNTVTTKYYQTPQWGGASLTCSGCHGNPPRTNYLTNAGGSGDSHSWLDDDAYEDLHGWNMGYWWPVNCRTCHNDTVQEESPWSRGTWSEAGLSWYYVALYGDVPINNYSKHVNGTADVAFDKVTPLVYTNTLSLADASYDAQTKTCSSVACHLAETSVTWGTPYRYWDSTECNRCHSY